VWDGFGDAPRRNIGKKGCEVKWSEGGSQIRDRSLIENTGPGWKIVPGGEYGVWQLNNRTDIPCSSWQHWWVGDSWTRRRLHDLKSVASNIPLYSVLCFVWQSDGAVLCLAAKWSMWSDIAANPKNVWLLIKIGGILIWRSAMALCYGALIWRSDMALWYGALIWRSAMALWYGALIWRSDMALWYGAPIWRSAMALWYGALVWRSDMALRLGALILHNVCIINVYIKKQQQQQN